MINVGKRLLSRPPDRPCCSGYLCMVQKSELI